MKKLLIVSMKIFVTLTIFWILFKDVTNDSFLSKIFGFDVTLIFSLALNAAVLAGQVDPSVVPTARVYGSYYAVVHADFTMPSNWVRVAESVKGNIYRFNKNPVGTR